MARWQAEWVAARLQALGTEVELVPISTTGDRRDEAIGTLGRQGVFTKEIQLALLDERIDLAVHSLKDLPTDPVAELTLAAVPERGPTGDALVSAAGAPLDELPRGARIGTGSTRRRAQLLHFRGDLAMADVRGNVETRLRKLREGDFDAVVLAEAGLTRLGLADQITQRLPAEIMLPAPGQGALGLETRAADASTRRLVVALDHPETHAAVLAERTMLLALEGGCLAPVAALGHVAEGRLTLIGRVLGSDGRQLLESTASAPPSEAEPLGGQVAEALLSQGAAELIRAARCT